MNDKHSLDITNNQLTHEKSQKLSYLFKIKNQFRYQLE